MQKNAYSVQLEFTEAAYDNVLRLQQAAGKESIPALIQDALQRYRQEMDLRQLEAADRARPRRLGAREGYDPERD